MGNEIFMPGQAYTFKKGAILCSTCRISFTVKAEVRTEDNYSNYISTHKMVSFYITNYNFCYMLSSSCII